VGRCDGQQCAVKHIVFDDSDIGSVVERNAYRELLHLALLQHETVVELLAASASALPDASRFRTGGERATWICMELYPRGTLASWIDAGHAAAQAAGLPLTLRNRLGLGRDLVAALVWVHSQNIVHADVKTLNAIVDSQGRARLADFGISVVLRCSEEMAEVRCATCVVAVWL
jgi:serine/threonine protein kinase